MEERKEELGILRGGWGVKADSDGRMPTRRDVAAVVRGHPIKNVRKVVGFF